MGDALSVKPNSGLARRESRQRFAAFTTFVVAALPQKHSELKRTLRELSNRSPFPVPRSPITIPQNL